MRTSDDKSDDLEGEGFQLGSVTSVSSRSAGDYAASRERANSLFTSSENDSLRTLLWCDDDA
eukprot:scaffold655_cov126-Skeletonema_dohrnii-CCMP3373.AAC.3